MKRVFWMALGMIGLVLGAIGAVIPLLPAFPFLLLAAVSFGKSSKRLHAWFTGTKLYKNNLHDFVQGRGMTWKTKIRIDHVHRYAYHGIWICDDGSCAGGQNHIGRGVGFPCAVFLF